jgi:hypothetical protein
MIPILWTNKTQGSSEYLIYGAVSANAIIGILSIRDIVQCKYSNDLSAVLKLGLIKQARYAWGLDWKLREKANMLTHKTGETVGRFLELASVNPEYREDLAGYF